MSLHLHLPLVESKRSFLTLYFLPEYCFQAVTDLFQVDGSIRFNGFDRDLISRSGPGF